MRPDHLSWITRDREDGAAPLLGTFLLDESGTVRWANRSVSQGLGYRDGELIGLRMWEIDEQVRRDQWPDAWEKLLALSHVTYRTSYLARDGRSIPVEVTVQALPYRGETVLSACVMDLTRFMKSERARRRSEELYRVLAENSEDAIFVLGADRRITYGNAAGARYLRCEQSEMPGRSLSTFFPPEYTDTCDDLVSRVFSTGERQSADIPTLLPDGLRWFNVRMAPLMETDSVSSVLVSATDITGRREREQALRTANQKLNMLSGVLRHDALNYLFALRGYHDLLARSDVEPEEAAGFLAGLDKNITLLERVLTFSREYQDLGVNEPRWQSVRTIVDRIAGTDGFGGVPVEFEGEDVCVYADPLLNRVIFNMLENAVTHADGLTSIRICTEPNGDTCTISISDDGCGVAEEEKERIFDRKVGKHTGFGLFLAREILAISGIGISETGREGDGARFEMRVPSGMWRTNPPSGESRYAGDSGHGSGPLAELTDDTGNG